MLKANEDDIEAVAKALNLKVEHWIEAHERFNTIDLARAAIEELKARGWKRDPTGEPQ